MKIEYQPQGVCSKLLTIEINDETKLIEDITFIGGCQGNLKAISKLLIGKEPAYAIEILSGITCGNKVTSCGDQLARALREALTD